MARRDYLRCDDHGVCQRLSQYHARRFPGCRCDGCRGVHLSRRRAQAAVDWPVLIAIASSFGVGKALEQSGVAKLFAGLLVEATQAWGPTATMAALYFGTMVLNELISNNAAAALSFPFCLESARLLGVNERPFIMAVTLAASYAFASPIGYQTHMMVFGPGGYRFTDFMRVGIPLNLLMWITAIILIPLIWPFHVSGL